MWDGMTCMHGEQFVGTSLELKIQVSLYPQIQPLDVGIMLDRRHYRSEKVKSFHKQ